jgi:hypothetical protein
LGAYHLVGGALWNAGMLDDAHHRMNAQSL